uniref:Uncharacterized protein n=1 Tax=Rhizophora mucronata TaxID=61149 RepID=A0A2P2NJF4_RHIMU
MTLSNDNQLITRFRFSTLTWLHNFPLLSQLLPETIQLYQMWNSRNCNIENVAVSASLVHFPLFHLCWL